MVGLCMWTDAYALPAGFAGSIIDDWAKDAVIRRLHFKALTRTTDCAHATTTAEVIVCG